MIRMVMLHYIVATSWMSCSIKAMLVLDRLGEISKSRAALVAVMALSSSERNIGSGETPLDGPDRFVHHASHTIIRVGASSPRAREKRSATSPV